EKEAGQQQRPARDAGKEHIRGVEGEDPRQDGEHEVVDGLGVLDAVRALQALAAAPEEVRVRGEDGDAGEPGVDALVWEVEEGLAAIAVEEGVDAEVAGGVGGGGGAGDAG